jgi:hypothetical protein
MKSVLFLCLFIGMFMIVHGIYEEKLEKMKKDVRVKYKFIPRTYYDEMMDKDIFSSQVSDPLFKSTQDFRSAGLPVR